MSSIDNSRANAQEEHTVLSELGTVFGHDDVECALVDDVSGNSVEIVFGDQVRVGVARGDGNDLFLLALENERDKQVEQMDGSDNVGLATGEDFLLQSHGILAATINFTISKISGNASDYGVMKVTKVDGIVGTEITYS